jgi:hypothetical protein
MRRGMTEPERDDTQKRYPMLQVGFWVFAIVMVTLVVTWSPLWLLAMPLLAFVVHILYRRQFPR